MRAASRCRRRSDDMDSSAGSVKFADSAEPRAERSWPWASVQGRISGAVLLSTAGFLLTGAGLLVVALLQTMAPAASFSQQATPVVVGEVSLNYVRKASAPAFQGMAVGLQIPGATTTAQQCLVDLGSSTVAFCDAALRPKLEHRKTNQAQCNMVRRPEP